MVENEEDDLDIAIDLHLVGGAVVGVVLVQPPTGGHARHEAHSQQYPVVVLWVRKDLTMPGIMAQEPKIRERQCQENGVQHLDPQRAAEYDQDGNAGCGHGQHAGNLPGVVAVLAVEKAGLGYPALQLKIVPVAFSFDYGFDRISLGDRPWDNADCGPDDVFCADGVYLPRILAGTGGQNGPRVDSRRISSRIITGRPTSHQQWPMRVMTEPLLSV